MKNSKKGLKTRYVAELLNEPITRMHTMLNKGIPEKLKPSKVRSESNGRMVYSFNEEDVDLLVKAFELKEIMSYREIKELLDKESMPSSGKELGKSKYVKKVEIVALDRGPINIDSRGGELLVNSREVARNFNKRHDSLLRDVDNIISNMESPQDCGHLFIESDYMHIQNKQVYKEYLLTRDGFSLLVMGFTGKKALQWKLKYIEAFNKMEEKLRSMLPAKESYAIEDPVKRAKAWIAEQEEREALKLETRQQRQIIGELKPKSDYTDRILRSNDLVTITQIAKDYGMSGQAMNTLLYDLEVQYKASGQWLLYKSYQDKGYTHSQTVEYIKIDGGPGTNMHTKWTQKGRLFLYNLLKSEGILPLIEK